MSNIHTCINERYNKVIKACIYEVYNTPFGNTYEISVSSVKGTSCKLVKEKPLDIKGIRDKYRIPKSEILR